MRHPFSSVFILIFAAITAAAQIKPDDYFPQESEFRELKIVSPEKVITGQSKLANVPNGDLISDVGFQRYVQRNYEFEKSKSLAIQVITLIDMKAAYSLMTLLGISGLNSGPPGDEYFSDHQSIHFSQGNIWVEIRGEGIPEDFIKRVAISMSNRIGQRPGKRPALISHLPKAGLDASTLKYFPGFKSFKTYTRKLPVWTRDCGEDMEIAQARYRENGEAGTLSLLYFPTNELAQDCDSKLTGDFTQNRLSKAYVKTVGPLVGILEGSFDPESANKILNSIQYSYSVQWIYEKKEKPSTIWGVPVAILGTVVKSVFFVSILAVLSIVAGVVFAFARFNFRRRKKALDDDINHLKMK
jgi:hypothetical protein